MDKKIRDIINSGLIEEYLFGTLAPDQRLEVEHLLDAYPELRKHMAEMQEVLWGMAEEMAIDPPPSVKARIKKDLQNISPTASAPTSSSYIGWLVAAAILVLSCAVYLYTGSEHAHHVQDLQAVIADCEKEAYATTKVNTHLQHLLDKGTIIRSLSSPDEKVDIIAFADVQEGRLYLDTRTIPDVPRGKCLQLWGDKDGTMIPITVLDHARDYMHRPLTYDPAFSSINLTVEELGANSKGSDHATVAALIASVDI